MNGLRITSIVFSILGVLLAVVGTIFTLRGGSIIPYIPIAIICVCIGGFCLVAFILLLAKRK